MEITQLSSQNNSSINTTWRKYAIIISLLLVFVGPLIAAWSLYSSEWYIPAKLNRGMLLEPIIPSNHLNLKLYNNQPVTKNFWANKWWIVYLVPQDCSDLCLQRLHDMKQIQTATGKYMDQVGRLMITVGKNPTLAERMEKNYPYMQQTWLSSQDYSQLKTQIHSQTTLNLNTSQLGNLLIADPEGNFMMVYQEKQKSQDLFKDMKRLLAANAAA